MPQPRARAKHESEFVYSIKSKRLEYLGGRFSRTDVVSVLLREFPGADITEYLHEINAGREFRPKRVTDVVSISLLSPWRRIHSRLHRISAEIRTRNEYARCYWNGVLFEVLWSYAKADEDIVNRTTEEPSEYDSKAQIERYFKMNTEVKHVRVECEVHPDRHCHQNGPWIEVYPGR